MESPNGIPMNAVGDPDTVATVVNPLHKAAISETAAGPAPASPTATAGVGAAAAAGPVTIVKTGGGGGVGEVRFEPDDRGTTPTEDRSMLQQVTDTIMGSVSVVASVAGSRTKDLARGALLRKVLRVVTTATLWSVLLVLLYAFNVYRTFDEVGSFDPSSTLQIDVGGCDVRLVSGSDGSSASVRITGSLLHQGSGGGHALDFDSSQEYVRSVYASSDGCDSHPQGRCFRTCKVELTMPTASARGWGSIKISQLPEARGRIIVDGDAGVVIGPQLTVVGDHMAIELQQPDFRSKHLFKVSGPISLAGVRVSASASSGSITALQHSVRYSATEPGTQYTLKVRQPSGRYQLRFNDDVAAGVLDTDPATRCPADTSSKALRRLVSYYDLNADNYVSIEEFRETLLQKVPMCCSSNCPLPLETGRQQAGECDTLVAAFFPLVGSYPVDNEGRSRYGQLLNSEFVAAIANYSDTALSPACYDLVTLTDTSISGGATAAFSLTLAAPQGDVDMTYVPAATAASSATQIMTKDPPVTMKLDRASAEVLRALGIKYGDRNENHRDVYLNVIANRGPLVADDYFVYSSRPVLLTSMNPALLKLVGANALVPDILTVTVHFNLGPEFYRNETIDLDAVVPTSGDNADIRVDGINITYRELIKVQTYAQLTQALTPLGQLLIKGKLVRITEHDGSGAGSRHKFYTLADGLRVDSAGFITQYGISNNYDEDATYSTPALIVETEYVGLYDDGLWVIGLNIAIASILALMLFFAASTYTKALIRMRHREHQIAAATNSRYQTVDGHELKGVMKVDVKSKWFTPFELPLEVLNVVVPYRQILFDSLRKFWTTRIELVPAADLDPSIPIESKLRSIPYGDFMDSYQQYCFHHRLKAIGNHMEIRQFLYLGNQSSNWCRFSYFNSGGSAGGAATDDDNGAPVRVKTLKIKALVGIRLNRDKIGLLAAELEKVKGVEDYKASMASSQRGQSFSNKSLVSKAANDLSDGLEKFMKSTKDQHVTTDDDQDEFGTNNRKRFTLLTDILAMNDELRAITDQYQQAQLDGGHRPDHPGYIIAPSATAPKPPVQRRYERITRLLADQAVGATEAPQGTKLLSAFLVHCCSFPDSAEASIADHAVKATQESVSVADFLAGLKTFKDFAVTHQLVDDGDRLAGKQYSYGTWVLPTYDGSAEQTVVGRKFDGVHTLFKAPELNGLIEGLGVNVELRSRQYIVGARFIDLHHVPITTLFMKEVLIDTFIQLIYALSPAVILLLVAFEAQLGFSRTTGIINPDTVDGSTLGNLVVQDHDLYYMTSYAIICSVITGTVVTCISIIYNYFSPSQDKPGHVVFRRALGVAIAVYYYAVCVFIMTLFLWQLVAAILDPEVNLVAGVAVVTVFFTCWRVAKRLLNLRKSVREEVSASLHDVMNENINAAWKRLNTVYDGAQGQAVVVKGFDESEGKTITLENIFDVLDKDIEGDEGYQKLDFEEFSELFDFLGFRINETLERNMFAFADEGNTGQINKNEFEKCSLYLMDVINEKVLTRLHLGNGDVLLAVLTVLLIFALVFPFLFLTIKLYSNQSNFSTVIHSMTVGITGVFAGSRGTRIEEQAKHDQFYKNVIRMALENMGM